MADVRVFETEVFYRPASAELRFLPEGPQQIDDKTLSWVAIQHGPQATHGSLNLLDLTTAENTTYLLGGRPGFALPTTRQHVFLIGLEHRLVLFDTRSGTERVLSDQIELDVEGTIINDGEAFAGGVIFGAKDLKFAEKKAGLYLYRRADGQLFRLRSDQVCSNGKVIIADERSGEWTLLDICSPRKTVVAYRLDSQNGRVEEVRTVVDLRSESVFPDGMVATPDGRSVIIAIYNPSAADYGEARQYGFATGELEAVWRCPGSPQVTCPCLIRHDGQVKLVLTTAVEHMDESRRENSPQAGCLFIGETPFAELPDAVRFDVSGLTLS